MSHPVEVLRRRAACSPTAVACSSATRRPPSASRWTPETSSASTTASASCTACPWAWSARTRPGPAPSCARAPCRSTRAGRLRRCEVAPIESDSGGSPAVRLVLGRAWRAAERMLDSAAHPEDVLGLDQEADPLLAGAPPRIRRLPDVLLRQRLDVRIGPVAGVAVDDPPLDPRSSRSRFGRPVPRERPRGSRSRFRGFLRPSAVLTRILPSRRSIQRVVD